MLFKFRWILMGSLFLLGAWLLFRILAPPKVLCHVVRARPLLQSVVMSGRVIPPIRSRLGLSQTGVVQRVRVWEGQEVRKGEVLLELDDREVRAQVEQARARLSQLDKVLHPNAREMENQARLQYEQAERDFTRSQKLRQEGILSQEQFEQARQVWELAQSRFTSQKLQASSLDRGPDRALTQAQLQASEAKLDQMRLLAPADGRILLRNVHPGDVAAPGSVLLEMALKDRTLVLVEANEKQLANIKLGQRASVSAEPYPDQNFEGVMEYIAPSVNAARGSVDLKLHIPNPPAYLRPDMTVSVNVQIHDHPSVRVLPVEAVRDPSSPNPFVLAIRKGRVVKVPIKLGLRSDRFLEIMEGLQEGERVLPALLKVYPPGTRVRTEEIH